MSSTPSALFDVHVFAIVQLKVTGILAADPQAAIAAACADSGLCKALQRLHSDRVEFADEFSHFLVDVAGDPDYERSQWFHSATEPLLELARTLVRWEEAGQPDAELAHLLTAARQALRQSA